MKEKNLLIFVILSALIIYFSGLNHGTPNWQRILQVFVDKEEIEKFKYDMLKLREKYYEKMVSFPSWEGKFTKEDFASLVSPHAHKPFEILSQETILDFSRGYILGLVLSDEQHAIRGLSNLNPKKLDFDPDHEYVYGNFYLYSLGVAIGIGKLLNFVKIEDISYYFTHPEDSEKIYTIARMVSAIGVILSIIVLWYLCGLIVKDKIFSFFCVTLFMLNPFIIYYGHQIKHHTWGMFWMLLSLYFYLKSFLDERKLQDYILSAIFAGFSVACVVSNGIFVGSYILFDFVVSKKIKIKKSVLYILTAILIFLIMTPYLPFKFRQWYNVAIAHNVVVYGYGRFGLIEGIQFILKTFNFGKIWFMLPLMFIGMMYIFLKNRSKEKFLLYVFILFFFYVGFFMKHEGVFSLTIPFFSLFSAYGIYSIITSRVNLVKVAGMVYSLIVGIVLILSTTFYDSLFVQKGNLTFAGEWINSNIPSGSSIGVLKGWALPGTFPAIRFLKYNLVNFPTDESQITDEVKDKFPEYVVVTGMDENTKFLLKLKTYYEIVKFFPVPSGYFGIKFRNYFIPTENIPVYILKLKPV